METEDDKQPLESLSAMIKQLSESPKASKGQIEKLHQSIDKALPHIKSNTELARTLADLKTAIPIHPEPSTVFHEEENSTPGQTLH